MSAAIVGAIAILTGEAIAAPLTEATRLAGIYDQILAAKFERARDELRQACPPAPAEACQALSVVALWWQIQIDLESRALDTRFEKEAQQAIVAADRWTRREPQRAEAWFYLAGAYGPLVEWHVFRGDRLAAARDGNRVRAALEKARSLDPALQDANFGIGMYHYYAAVMPAAAKVLRLLLFLPGGNREQGLNEMKQAREHGQLLTGEADYQLHWIDLWYEHQPQHAIELLRGLDGRYPTNPVFLRRIARVQSDYLHDHEGALATWQVMLERAMRGAVEFPQLAEMDARLGMGTELATLGRSDAAIEQFTMVSSERAQVPYSAQATAEFELGMIFDRLSQRDRAAAWYRAASAHAPSDDQLHIRSRARDRLDRKF